LVAGGGAGGAPKLGVGALPVGLKIEDAAMIDVRVWLTGAPGATGWVGGEVAEHVLMNEFLQVKVEGVAGGPEDDVGADSGRARTSPLG
jgi:hypothetical protein